MAAVELNREEKRALRKEEKRRAKLGASSNGESSTRPNTDSSTQMQTSEPVAKAEEFLKEKKDKKKKKKKDTMNEDDEDHQLIVTRIDDGDEPSGEPDEKSKKSKKRKHREEGDGEKDEEHKSKKSKSKDDDGPVVTSPVAVEATSELKKSKKKSKRHEGAENEPGAPSDAPVDDAQSKKKKKKKDHAQAKDTETLPSTIKAASNSEYIAHNFPDPTDDSTLPEASSKSLIYAYQYAERNNPNRKKATAEDGSWKFSKARQNWLARHIWYEDAVPETYLDLVVHYLKSIQGGARDAMIKGCEILLNPLPTSQPAAESVEGEDQTTMPKPTRKVTFEDVPPEDDEKKEAENDDDPSEARRVEVRKARAGILREALRET